MQIVVQSFVSEHAHRFDGDNNSLDHVYNKGGYPGMSLNLSSLNSSNTVAISDV